MASQNKDRQVRIEKRPAMRVAFLRHTGPYNEAGPTFQKMMKWAFSNGLFNPQTKVLGICHDDPDVTPAEKRRLDCCVTVDESFTSAGEVDEQNVCGGEYVMLTHHGSFEGLADSYRWLYGEWLATSGRLFDNRPPMEIYVNNRNDTPEQDLVTEICVLLQSK